MVKLKIDVFAYMCIFSLTTSQSRKLILKTDLKLECPYFYSKFFFWSVSAKFIQCLLYNPNFLPALLSGAVKKPILRLGLESRASEIRPYSADWTFTSDTLTPPPQSHSVVCRVDQLGWGSTTG